MTDPPAQPDADPRPPRIVVTDWPRLLTITQAALYLGISPQTIRNRDAGWTREDGTKVEPVPLPGRKTWGSKPVYDRHALDRLIDENNGVSDLWIDAGRIAK